tara:strand:+ start:1234 stop:1845 length:612 start_codon:yes stop_codon:yes gene_type:complete
MFIWSAFAHLIALTSPGPDTAIVIRQVSIHGRLEGIKTSLGIGFGILIHCILAISGISLIILANDLYKFVISLVGGIYILYLGLTMYLSGDTQSSDIANPITSKNNSFYIGLITNIFNIKAFLFFVSLFSILIDSLIGIYLYLYPIYFSITSALWFIFLSYVLTNSKYKNFNIYKNKYILSIMSLILCFIGSYVLVTAVNEYF